MSDWLCSGGESSYIAHFGFMKCIVDLVFSGEKDKMNSLDLIPSAVDLYSSE